MRKLSASDHGWLGAMTASKRARHNRGGVPTAKTSRKLESLATKALGIKPGPPTKAERRRPDTIRMERPDDEVLFYSLEDDYVPESEPWETRFPDYTTEEVSETYGQSR